ncbi:hypothetical protein [Rhodovulum sulfidophilum]|uniref:Uncharacterized protein n=1 Tax=Rhodovulum sulfidophilum TaxID=35806 RepID=A0ABS1S1S6_RHOSU|nr:hypothetical protein [Rhodovulum sulfidophilum]MBL3611285.1 hypothetical protein [Rhodovulum sulfidophilum]MCE8458072.1 hypothetical protein [Rhodovulum sulfidophilum]
MLMRQAEPLFSPVRIEIFSEDGPRLQKHSEQSAWHIRDDSQLSEINSSIKSNRKIEKFRSALDTAVAIAASYLSANAGSGPMYFPIFSSPSAGDLYSPDQVLIQQNKIGSDTISEFLSNFLSIGSTARPKLLISYHDRAQLLKLLSKVSSLVEVTQAFGKECRPVKLDSSKSSNEEILSFVLSGNHLPNLNRYLDGDPSILMGWAAAKSVKLLDVPDKAEKIIEDTISKVLLRLKYAEQRSKSFWMTLYIQLLLDRAFFADGAGGHAQQALLLARQLGSSPLIAHCQRFANQTLGVGAEALAVLNDSVERFQLIPENSEDYLLLTPSRLGATLNRNTTALISSTSPVDPGRFEADFLQTKEIFPSYSNIGMMASAAAVAAMIKGHKKRAVSLLEQASIERSLPIDGFNIRMNLLCAESNYAGSIDERDFRALCEDVRLFPFPVNWEYHRVRIASNLLTVATSPELKDLAWNVIDKNRFLADFDGWGDEAKLRNFLIRSRYTHYLVGGTLAGQFGRFCSRTGLFPCIDKDWT